MPRSKRLLTDEHSNILLYMTGCVVHLLWMLVRLIFGCRSWRQWILEISGFGRAYKSWASRRVWADVAKATLQWNIFHYRYMPSNNVFQSNFLAEDSSNRKQPRRTKFLLGTVSYVSCIRFFMFTPSIIMTRKSVLPLLIVLLISHSSIWNA